MTNIVVQDLDLDNHQFTFRVDVEEGDSCTTHLVELDCDEYQNLTDGKITPKELIQCSFEFLLERESKESILNRFNASVISRYFPEYSSEILKYF
jgi:hypothetical protein